MYAQWKTEGVTKPKGACFLVPQYFEFWMVLFSLKFFSIKMWEHFGLCENTAFFVLMSATELRKMLLGNIFAAQNQHYHCAQLCCKFSITTLNKKYFGMRMICCFKPSSQPLNLAWHQSISTLITIFKASPPLN